MRGQWLKLCSVETLGQTALANEQCILGDGVYIERRSPSRMKVADALKQLNRMRETCNIEESGSELERECASDVDKEIHEIFLTGHG